MPCLIAVHALLEGFDDLLGPTGPSPWGWACAVRNIAPLFLAEGAKGLLFGGGQRGGDNRVESCQFWRPETVPAVNRGKL